MLNESLSADEKKIKKRQQFEPKANQDVYKDFTRSNKMFTWDYNFPKLK